MNETGRRYAISQWPDVAEIDRRCHALTHSPLRALRPAVLDSYRSWFEQNCAGSKQAHAEAAKYIPGGVQQNLAFNKPFPLCAVRTDGPYIWDIDGNRYLDFLQAGAATVLGSNYAPVREKVVELLHGCGPVTGLFNEYETKLAKLIHDFVPSVDMFRMLASGTESAMAAIRAARAFTGKAKVIKVGGGYHGWSDQLVFALRLPGTGPMEATGIPAGCYEHTQEAYPGDIEGLRDLLVANRDSGGTAAVIVEPIGPESGTRPATIEYNRALRELCDEFETLLIFDEVVSGFRLGMGGAQGFMGVRPDLTMFGKCVAGGYPGAGGVGGRADVMATFAGGISAMGKRAFVGGTLTANPLSCAAGYHALQEMDRTDAPLKAGLAGDRITRGLQRLIDAYDLPWVVYNFGSVVHLHSTGVLHLDLREPESFAEVMPRKEGLEDMSVAFTAEGVVTLAASRLYTSMADTDEIVDDALARFERVFKGVDGVPSSA